MCKTCGPRCRKAEPAMMPHFYASDNPLSKSRTCSSARPVAHNLIHRKCSKLPKQGRAAVDKKVARRCGARCHIFTHGKIFLMNQGTAPSPPGLLTILSTECVGKCGAAGWRSAQEVQICTCRAAGNTLHCRIRFNRPAHFFRRPFCSPFFKPQAGLSGFC